MTRLNTNTSNSEPEGLEGDEKNVADLATASKTDSTSPGLEKVETHPDGVVYPTGVKLYLITLALCLSVFLMAIDNSIIATAVPQITDEFNSLSDVGWYGSGV